MPEAGFTSRTVLNRQRVDVLRLGVADGLFTVCNRILDNTHPPDAPPLEWGLPYNGGCIVYIDGKRVASRGLYTTQPKKPRRGRIQRPGITAFVGYGFPARFNELGTVRQPARPFFSPVVWEQVPDTGPSIRSSVRRFLNAASLITGIGGGG